MLISGGYFSRKTQQSDRIVGQRVARRHRVVARMRPLDESEPAQLACVRFSSESRTGSRAGSASASDPKRSSRRSYACLRAREPLGLFARSSTSAPRIERYHDCHAGSGGTGHHSRTRIVRLIRPRPGARFRPGLGSRMQSPRSPFRPPQHTSYDSRRRLPGRDTARSGAPCHRCWRPCTRNWR
jgi:hypothetical protein